ncbi:LD-carboxypeptidase [Chlorogloeopsis fritschii PCC 9212]|uniref:Peptidase S66 n=1 Tax=Chlorogloeopsis fritschii PCC 6912 TaxID=211165 RepID=A0A433NAA7_CHLFR|nr:LD-carboxypeptidase [Chlorogloeopsis fritschii]RUR78773.1 peptidase S66 [Chlorogloeopsis fritschii PCC 6912]
MTIKRRKFVKFLGLAGLSSQIPVLPVQAKLYSNTIIKPPRLKVGDTVGLISPAGIIEPQDIEVAKKALLTLGLKVKLGVHILDSYGYLAGKDIDRATDVNAMFGDRSVKAIITMRGGWGCNRILPLINYSLIRSHPKIFMGYSDITSLLLAIYARSGLITFHGPVATSTWNEFSVDYVKRILFNAEVVTMTNTLTTEIGRKIITPGKAKGKLVGGNLSVLSAMLGSSYLPSWQDSILFVEEIGEDIYRVDRMLTQLKNAGIFNQIVGFVFGKCTNCSLGDQPSLTLAQVLKDHIQPLGIPAWYGSMIGHIKDKFTVPVGVDVEIDAENGTLRMLETAVR